MAENPYQLPAPSVVAALCAHAAWRDDVSDRDRVYLEWAADTIRALLLDKCRLLSRAEHLEAEADEYATLLYGPNQQGGAA